MYWHGSDSSTRMTGGVISTGGQVMVITCYQKNLMVCKMYITLFTDYMKTSEEFVSHAYCLVNTPGLWLVHYVGNESVYDPTSHGNKVRGTQGYLRTCPSVRAAVKKAFISEPPGKVY